MSARPLWRHQHSPSKYSFFCRNHQLQLSGPSVPFITMKITCIFSFHHWLLMVPSSTQGLHDYPNCLPFLPVKTVIAFKMLNDAIIWMMWAIKHSLFHPLPPCHWYMVWDLAGNTCFCDVFFENREYVCAGLPVSFKSVYYGAFWVGFRVEGKIIWRHELSSKLPYSPGM